VCGIYGLVSAAPIQDSTLLERMGESLRHRGPDGSAVLSAPNVAIGTERLRIIDLHERADQPFASPDGDVWLQANGEIYNAQEIRSRYLSFPFRSNSDVESILPLYLEHGAEAVEQLDGMFALAIWDNRSRTLLLARDRAGEKPLFYARAGAELLFASEVQCLLTHPAISRGLDREALTSYLAFGYVPEPRTAFSSIRRVPSGCWMRFSPDGEETVRYWSPLAFELAHRDEGLAIRETRRLIEKAVQKQVMSDVPVGVFISGGLDSSILTVLAARELGVARVHTFSAQFSEESFDESAYAAETARRMLTHHVQVRTDDVTLRDALANVVSGLAEPLADPAILPTFLLARAAREHVKVVLSGEGADELFGGYPTYLGHKVMPLWNALPGFLRSSFHRVVSAVPSSSRRVTLEFLLKRFLRDAGREWIERHLSWFGTGIDHAALAHTPGFPPFVNGELAGRDPLSGAMLLDYGTYLRDNLLVKVDRATMLSSVEARAPYLDRDVTAFALSLPPELRVRRATTKWVLKKAAEAWLPREIIYRRKRGLSVPIAGWINGTLKDEVDRLLDRAALDRHGLIDAAYVSRLLAEHRSGAANHARAIWTVVMLQYWMENWT
jgi:asparagine synthase (glutamine-hydrolysing)